MRLLSAAMLAVVVFVVLLGVYGAAANGGLVDPQSLVATSVIILASGGLVIAAPLWLVFRQRIADDRLGWAALGFIATAVPSAALAKVALNCAGTVEACAALPDPSRHILIVAAINGLFGALAYLAALLAWRRLPGEA